MKHAPTEALWKRVDLALNQATTRTDTVSELNRLFSKWRLGSPEGYISQADSTIRQEWLTPQQLALFVRGHPRAEPRRLAGPLVAVEYQGKTYMLDGTNRINAWLRDGDCQAHEVIVLSRASRSE